jgi:hypothetical protein
LVLKMDRRKGGVHPRSGRGSRAFLVHLLPQ